MARETDMKTPTAPPVMADPTADGEIRFIEPRVLPIDKATDLGSVRSSSTATCSC